MAEIIPMKVSIEFTIDADNGEDTCDIREEVDLALHAPITAIGGKEITYTVELA